MLAKCLNPTCGHKFETRIFGPGIMLTLKNVETNCPICDGRATIEDGHYLFDEQGISKVLKTISQDDILEIQKLSNKALLEDYTPEQFKDALSEINPKYKSLFEKFIVLSKSENFRYWIKQLLVLLGIIIGGFSHAFNDININIDNQNSTSVRQNESYAQNYERQLRVSRLTNIKANKNNVKRTSSKHIKRKNS